MQGLERRRSGVLLHPTALAGARGALGAAARDCIDWLAAAGYSVWQVLPLGPTGADGSPYWARSDHAGNPALIDWHEAPDADAERGDYLRFCTQAAPWLEDYALFEALAESHGGVAWWDWPAGQRDREPPALDAARRSLAARIEQRRREQWVFERQWNALRDYARGRGVLLFGDLPIYVAPDSAATWAARAQFQLDAVGRPLAVAGVPPDYFSADGQLWGNPLYDWEQARRDGFAFWRARVARQLERFDLVRIDHFRGLAAHWAVPAGATSARAGRWLPTPGAELLAAVRAGATELPLVAEDLGFITPDVEALRREFDLPGMRVLQFGFDGSGHNPHLPHNYLRHSVAYTGTHDNDTTLGWYRTLDAATAARVDDYLGSEPARMPLVLVRALLASVAGLAVVPVADVLGLGSEARFNTPGTTAGNWRWRLPPGALTPALAQRHAHLNQLYGRIA
ncbi:MAG: 4-alpha-glucanotransferase [Gammaproteobacteria bacterium]|nr:4-alpha-glucanotransferase [Gammaproteobacteria bacterium]